MFFGEPDSPRCDNGIPDYRLALTNTIPALLPSPLRRKSRLLAVRFCFSTRAENDRTRSKLDRAVVKNRRASGKRLHADRSTRNAVSRALIFLRVARLIGARAASPATLQSQFAKYPETHGGAVREGNGRARPGFHARRFISGNVCEIRGNRIQDPESKQLQRIRIGAGEHRFREQTRRSLGRAKTNGAIT